jgi:hypothetical protein
MASPDQSRKEGGLLRSEDLLPLPLALTVGHVHGRSPEDGEDFLHRREAGDVPVTTVLFSLAILRGGVTVVFLKHVALLEGVVDWSLVVWTRLFQHVIEHSRSSRGRSRALAGRVNRESLVPVVIASLRACFSAGLLALLASLVLLLGVFGLAALRGASFTCLPFLSLKMAPTASSPEAKLVAMSNSSLESTGGLLPSLRTRSRQVIPSRKVCTISD